MKAKVELIYDDASKNRKLDVPIKGAPEGMNLMNAIERGVEKLAKDDKDWRRWNLINIEERDMLRLGRPVVWLRGTAVVLADGRAESSTSYEEAPLITDRDGLRVGDEVFVKGLLGEIRRARIDEVDGDRGRATDDVGVMLFLEFGRDDSKSWRCYHMRMSGAEAAIL